MKLWLPPVFGESPIPPSPIMNAMKTRRVSFSEVTSEISCLSDDEYDRTCVQHSMLNYNDMVELLKIRRELIKNCGAGVILADLCEP